MLDPPSLFPTNQCCLGSKRTRVCYVRGVYCRFSKVNTEQSAVCTLQDGMGYDEEQWGKPRWQWIAQARQQIFDQTFHKIASMGWMFCPIEPYNVSRRGL